MSIVFRALVGTIQTRRVFLLLLLWIRSYRLGQVECPEIPPSLREYFASQEREDRTT